ncbi:MAG: gliding motility-associated lipoprotein GldH [Roseivirga sp.]|jgi:gliding motility-associated lipoprotein GldH
MIKPVFKVCFIALCLLTLNSCDSNRVYEDVYDFEEGIWNMDTIPAFSFEINDAAPKRILLNVRNSIEFKTQNLYLTYYLIDETGTEIKSELVNVLLFDPITGKPLGKGQSIFQHEVEILTDYNFPKVGVFKIRVAQYMRETDLAFVPSVGIRVEDIQK